MTNTTAPPVPQLWVTSATGTNVGKTSFAVALLRQLHSRRLRAAGWKPIETGVPAGQPSQLDAEQLAGATGLLLDRQYTFRDPISAHLAARREGVEINLALIATQAVALAREHSLQLLLVETAGGLFSPLSELEENAHLVATLQPARHFLVVRNQLGVLHDTLATLRAAETLCPPTDIIVASYPDTHQDLSMSSNLEELTRRLRRPSDPQVWAFSAQWDAAGQPISTSLPLWDAAAAWLETRP